MRKILLFTLTISVFMLSCSSTKKTAAQSQNASLSQSLSAQDGLTTETAIVIKEKSERAGIDAEYKWIKENYKRYTIISQSLSFDKNKSYDIIKIELPDGKLVSLYFDITSFFGKF